MRVPVDGLGVALLAVHGRLGTSESEMDSSTDPLFEAPLTIRSFSIERARRQSFRRVAPPR